ncbi:MAG: DUF4249 domain-containing protein [Bacteroidales bacterium]|jgi:hypothetical protein
MKQAIILILSLTLLLASCSEPYDAKVNSNEMILAVNGMITNENATYHIRLSYAAPYDSTYTGTPIDNASVNVTDDHNNNYYFTEGASGDYVSDSLQFTAQPGRTYTLHINTPGGTEYESYGQRLFPEVQPDRVYSEFDKKEVIDKSSGLYVLSQGVDILVDIANHTDTLPRFRFTSNLLTQYFYQVCPPFQSCISYYCWQTDNANADLNLTGGEYSISSASINKHNVCFIDDDLMYYGIIYIARNQGTGTPYVAVATQAYESNYVTARILYMQQYTLNNETYEYYKNMNLQLQSEGKLFDPIAAQLVGNIKCAADPNIKVFGFFEASSVSRTAYRIDFRNLTDNQPTITETGYVLPPESNGCEINNPPAIWVY